MSPATSSFQFSRVSSSYFSLRSYPSLISSTFLLTCSLYSSRRFFFYFSPLDYYLSWTVLVDFLMYQVQLFEMFRTWLSTESLLPESQTYSLLIAYFSQDYFVESRLLRRFSCQFYYFCRMNLHVCCYKSRKFCTICSANYTKTFRYADLYFTRSDIPFCLCLLSQFYIQNCRQSPLY